MSEKMILEIVSSTGEKEESRIKDLYMPAYLGRTGILYDHLPYISILKFGNIAYTDLNNNKHYLFIQDGIIEVVDNKITLISDSIEKSEDFDSKEIESKLKEVERQIQSSLKGEITPEELDKALEEKKILKIKLNICRKSKKH